MGSNMAEAHPVGFQWVVEAKKLGARVIHIDPHFTRTSALADTFVPIRVGSDIAFLGGVIRYILENGLDFREYVTAYTNASFLVSPDYRDTEDLEGIAGVIATRGRFRTRRLSTCRLDAWSEGPSGWSTDRDRVECDVSGDPTPITSLSTRSPPAPPVSNTPGAAL